MVKWILTFLLIFLLERLKAFYFAGGFGSEVGVLLLQIMGISFGIVFTLGYR